MRAHITPSLETFEADKKAQEAARVRRSELIQTLQAAVGRSIDVKGYPSRVVFTTKINTGTNRPNLVTAPVYSITDTEYEPREVENGTLIAVSETSGDIRVAVANPDEAEIRTMTPNIFQGYNFRLNNIIDIHIADEA